MRSYGKGPLARTPGAAGARRRTHAAAGARTWPPPFPYVTSGYMGEQWLATFALPALEA